MLSHFSFVKCTEATFKSAIMVQENQSRQVPAWCAAHKSCSASAELGSASLQHKASLLITATHSCTPCPKASRSTVPLTDAWSAAGPEVAAHLLKVLKRSQGWCWWSCQPFIMYLVSLTLDFCSYSTHFFTKLFVGSQVYLQVIKVIKDICCHRISALENIQHLQHHFEFVCKFT